MKPTSINANRQKKELIVSWDDGHISKYSFSLLRAGCPCADCRGGHDKMGKKPDPTAFTAELPDTPATHLANLIPVGFYGITPIWEDGHEAGIYSWEYLRALCPCEDCRKP
jgi:DUF971 family protein